MTTREVSYNLSGSVRNMSLPVAGTTVMLYDYWSTSGGLMRHYLTEQATGPKGEFNFDVRKGIYSVEVVPNRDTRFARQSIDPIKVTTNTTIAVNLKHGSTFSGTVRTTQGQSIGACDLIFFGIEPEPVRALEPVNSNGAFSISLPQGKYYIGCRYHQPSSGSNSTDVSFLCPSWRVIELFGDLRQDIVLPELVLFKGLVTNPQSHPVADVKVTLRASATSERLHWEEPDVQSICYTNRKGEFEIWLEPGSYDVKLEPGPESHLSERTVSSVLVDQARTRTYSLGAGYRLSGTITFEGEPVQNALVTASGGKIDTSVLTDSEGAYAFSLSGGAYDLSVTAQPDSLARLPFRLLAPFLCQVNLAEDTYQDVVLDKGICLSGTVTDAEGRARHGVPLALYQDQGRPPSDSGQAGRALMFGITGDDGTYEFRALAGRYWLVINNQISTAQLLEAQEEDVQNDVTWHSGCIVSFELVSEFDEPIASCKVSGEPYIASSENTADPVNGLSGEDGVCTLNLPSGIYSFHIQPPEQGSFEPKQIRQLSISTDVRRKVKLSLKAAP